MKKKKTKLKKITKIIILIIILSSIGIIIKPQINKQPKQKKNIVKKELTEEEKKLKELDNIHNKIDYFNKDYLERYINYKHENENLSIEQVIKNVNMNLDKTKYIDIKEAKNLNTEKILVNKYYFLTENYIPDNLEPINNHYSREGMKLTTVAKEAFEEMASEAKKEGYTIIAMSSYRSYEYQVNLYNRYANADGIEMADTYSGRPGHSEHQTGLAVDVYNGIVPYTSFEETKEFSWMQDNAYKYGFILRFPKDKETETGYQYESWHYRYVGKEIASYIKEHNISFEEYYATKIKDW